MKNAAAVRAALAAAAWSTATSVALASEDSGTSAVGEMQVSGSQFAMILGAVVALGLVIWVVAKKLG